MKSFQQFLSEAKEYGSHEWHHELFAGAKKKGIEFEHKQSERGHELQAKSPEHEVNLKKHLDSWLSHEGKSDTGHQYIHPHTGYKTILHRGNHDKKLTDKIEAAHHAKAEHDSWSSGQHFDRMVGRYSGGRTSGGPYVSKK